MKDSRPYITLEEFMSDLTPEEEKFVEQEVKYLELLMGITSKRQELVLTQAKLAELSRVPRTTISKIESGSRNVTLNTLMKLAQAMDSTLELRLT